LIEKVSDMGRSGDVAHPLCSIYYVTRHWDEGSARLKGTLGEKVETLLLGRIKVVCVAVGAALLMACGVALLVHIGPAEAAFPGKNGQIGGEGEWSPDGTKVVFSRNENSSPDSSEIYVKDVASGETTQVTNTPDTCSDYCPRGNFAPAWSPDGSKIAFVTARDFGGGDYCEYLAVMNSDGSDQKIISGCDEARSNIAWSPDGKEIASRTYVESADSVIVVIKANGTGSRRLYAEPPGTYFSDGAPEWSPDGKQVLFSSDTYDTETWEVVDRALWRVNADGSNKTRLIGTDHESTGWPEPWYAWSPDGTKIAYEKDGEIWTMKPDGSAQTDTNTPVPTGVFDWQPLCTIKGTSANNTLTGTSAKDIICGLGGNDQIKGLAGADVLLGGEGDDTLSGGKGNDRIFGGFGTDTASYQSSTTAVRASMIEEGATGEGTDAFMTLENLTGSALADELIGSSRANVLRGGKGGDILRGRGANDTILGEAGADQHYGENGDDTLKSIDGVKGNDTLNGGPSTDTCLTDATEKSVTNCEG
jgi:hypothetical protein